MTDTKHQISYSPGMSLTVPHLSANHGVGMAGIAFAFMVDKNGVQLVEPGWTHLEGIRGRTMTPSAILFELIQKGLYLVPDPSDVESAGLVVKVRTALPFALPFALSFAASICPFHMPLPAVTLHSDSTMIGRATSTLPFQGALVFAMTGVHTPGF